MIRIKRLPAHEIQKIAAGEVVERPANLVKELVENAIDAFAKQITVYVEEGGRELIRVVDNGHGMSAEDARMSIEHHATSKIYGIHDLKSLDTYGFRGEALSSITAVSHTVIITKDPHAVSGIELTIQGNIILQEKPIHCQTGTDITITKLFYNVPARKKFLKKRETELRCIEQLLQALSLVHRDIHFKLLHDDKVIFNYPPTTTLESRLTQVWGYDFTRNMLPFKVFDEEKQYVIEGSLSHHNYFRYDRSMIFFFVNYRLIKNTALARALLRGYQNVLPPARFPAAVISIHVNPELIDVNIHPRKEEIEFLHAPAIERLLQTTVKDTLSNYLSLHITNSVLIPGPEQSIPAPYQKPRDQNFHVTTTIIGDPFPQDTVPLHLVREQPYLTESLKSESTPALAATLSDHLALTHTQDALPTQKRTYHIVGHYKKTYILLEQPEGLFVVDQHAAHERILYELFLSKCADIATVSLLFPHIITLNTQELGVLEPYLPLFKKYGITMELFGFNQLAVLATPLHLKDQNLEDLVRQTIGWIVDYKTLEREYLEAAVTKKMLAQMACKAAIKAGDTLTQKHMEQLLDDLQTTPNHLTCPHGRPTGWLLDIHEIEKKFKRKL